jgi:hypothetical protein
VLALPHHLVPALAAAVVAAGDRSAIASRYRAALMTSLHFGGLLMGWEPLRVDLPPSDLHIEEQIWRADLDKLVHVVVLSDGEEDDEPVWAVDADAGAIGARLDDVDSGLVARGECSTSFLSRGWYGRSSMSRPNASATRPKLGCPALSSSSCLTSRLDG